MGCALADRPETVDIRVISAVYGPFAFLGDAQGTSRAGAPHPDSGAGAPDEGLSGDEIPENAPSDRSAEESEAHKIRLMTPKGVLVSVLPERSNKAPSKAILIVLLN